MAQGCYSLIPAPSSSERERTADSEPKLTVSISKVTSELQPQPELKVPRHIAVRVRADRPERAVSETRVRRREARMVQKVEDLGSHFQLHTFFGYERLVDVRVEIVNAVDAQTGKVAGGIARVLVARIRKAVQVKEGGDGRIASGFGCHVVQGKLFMLMPVLSWGQMTLGRWLPFANRPKLSEIAMGWPDCCVIRVEIDQSPTTASRARFILPPTH